MKTIYCDLDGIDQAFLSLYKSPTYETSTFKGIPMEHFRWVTRMLPVKNRRIKYRGASKPGYTRPQSFCHKFAADTFAIYYDNDYELHLGRPE